LIKPTWATRLTSRRRLRTLWLLVALPFISPACATLGDRGQTLVPTRYQVRTGPFLIYSNTPIPADSPAVRCLHSLESDLTTKLAYRSRPGDDPVEIYILNDRNAYTHFLKFYYPELPSRRAFFLAQGDRRVVYTYLSDRLEEDLRHEAAHALIRGCYGDLPLWLDEGLAEYFETRADAVSTPDEHLSRIPEDRREGWVPDLPRLESLTDIHQMTPRDYRESWAWAHLMLSGDEADNSLLITYLNAGQSGARTQPLSQLLSASDTTSKRLISHLEEAEAGLLARRYVSPAEEPVVRLQDRGADSAVLRAVATPPPAPRPSLLRRIGSWLGL
jgi:hypothetical protein